MADLDYITVCQQCLSPVEGLQMFCPKCKGDVGKMPSLLLSSLRTLKAKGWIVKKWEVNVDKECEHHIRLQFKMFAPHPAWGTGAAGGTVPDFGDFTPSVLCRDFQKLHWWVKSLPAFALPFGQGLCDKCIPQGADWYFCRVRCPDGRWVKFGELPHKCPYHLEQTLTMKDRFDELDGMGLFTLNPVTRRKCAKWNQKATT